MTTAAQLRCACDSAHAAAPLFTACCATSWPPAAAQSPPGWPVSRRCGRRRAPPGRCPPGGRQARAGWGEPGWQPARQDKVRQGGHADTAPSQAIQGVVTLACWCAWLYCARFLYCLGCPACAALGLSPSTHGALGSGSTCCTQLFNVRKRRGMMSTALPRPMQRPAASRPPAKPPNMQTEQRPHATHLHSGHVGGWCCVLHIRMQPTCTLLPHDPAQKLTCGQRGGSK